MQKRTLGRTGLEVSLLTYGCGAVGGLMTRGAPDDQLHTVARALELGVNFFDTAPLYGDGASERNLGRILAELRPDIVLGTKVRIATDQKADIGAAVAASLAASLERLGRDSVDILQLHNAITRDGRDGDLSPAMVLDQVVPAFARLKREGRIRAIGMTAVGDTAALVEVIESGAFDTAQIVVNLLNPSAAGPVATGFPGQDYDRLIVRASACGMGTIAIRVLAGGALSGEEARHPLGMPVVAPIGSGRDYATDVRRARRLAEAVTGGDRQLLVETAIRYVASMPDVSTLQVGIADTAQFENAAAAVEKGPLGADVREGIATAQADFVDDGL